MMWVAIMCRELPFATLSFMAMYVQFFQRQLWIIKMKPLITTNQLQELLDSGAKVLICDCRFDLAQVSAGREAYAKGHIPGAIYVDLDTDLSGTKTGTNGRHPLQDPDDWATTRQRLGIASPGINSSSHVIAYDS